MIYLLMFLAIYSLSFCIRNLSGPFNTFGFIRNKLMTNSMAGVFFYELFSCPFCIGFHCGYMIYILQCNSIQINYLILWGFAGSTIVALFDSILEKFNKV